MKFPGRSALANVLQVADIQSKFQLKIVDRFSSTNLLRPPDVLPVTVARTKSKFKSFTK